MAKVLFAAGGSIGHIAPCVAVWRAVQGMAPEAEAHFVTSTRTEDMRFLESERMPFTALSSRHVSLLTIIPAFFRAHAVLRRQRPAVVFTKGGGVTIPVALAAWMRGIPIVVHESDAVPGRATKWISKFATKTIFGFPSNPLRPGITQGSRERGLALTGFSGTRPILLVMGGSQGAQALNEAINAHIDELLRIADVIHITGEGKVGAARRPGYWSAPFLRGHLADLYATVSLAVSRAGAGSIGELAGNGIPMILVPLEGVAHDHQVKNAEAVAASGGCILLRQASLDANLVAIVHDLAVHPEKRALMKQKILSLHIPQADAALAKILLAMACEHCGVS